LKQLCECCSRQPLADPILQLYESIIASYQQNNTHINLSIELQVLEGLCIAISRQLRKINVDERNNVPVVRIIQPIITRFASLINSQNSSSHQVIAEIERLTVIVRYLEVPPDNYANAPYDTTVIVNLMTEAWPLLNSASQHYKNDTDLAEKLCRLHKHALRKCGADAYAPLLNQLLHHLVNAFNTSYQSPYLYAASICITEYGDDKVYIPKLFEMISSLSSTVFTLLPNLESATSHPDIVEEFFYLVGRFMNYCPEPLVTSPLLDSLLQFAVLTMQIQHRSAHKGMFDTL